MSKYFLINVDNLALIAKLFSLGYGFVGARKIRYLKFNNRLQSERCHNGLTVGFFAAFLLRNE
jgi:hypothetical protein